MRDASFNEANQLIARPSRVVLAVSVDDEEKANIIPLGWKMNTSFKPPMFAISVGLTRYSHRLIKEGREFVLAWPSEDMVEQVLYCGTRSGRSSDKFKEAGLTALAAAKVRPPLIEECVVNFECVLFDQLDTGDHTIFVGEVVASHVADAPKRNLISIGAESGYIHLGGNQRYRFGVVKDE
jgi:flavin reductase (DIM6/NTAB) family NADH-FMN oxidoreductase RutF